MIDFWHYLAWEVKIVCKKAPPTFYYHKMIPWVSQCISLLYTESRSRSEDIDLKTATFGTFLSILLLKDALECQADSNAPLYVKSSSYLLKKY